MDGIEEVKDDSMADLMAILLIATALLAGLKLFGIGLVANWSWWAVTSPLWVPMAFILGIYAVVVLLALVCE